jgi:hypothetical protein
MTNGIQDRPGRKPDRAPSCDSDADAHPPSARWRGSESAGQHMTAAILQISMTSEPIREASIAAARDESHAEVAGTPSKGRLPSSRAASVPGASEVS